MLPNVIGGAIEFRGGEFKQIQRYALISIVHCCSGYVTRLSY